MEALFSNRLPTVQPVQALRWRVSGAVDAPFPNRFRPAEPVQMLLPLASGGMDAANRSRDAVDNKGMEARDGFGPPEGQVA